MIRLYFARSFACPSISIVKDSVLLGIKGRAVRGANVKDRRQCYIEHLTSGCAAAESDFRRSRKLNLHP